MSNIGSSSWYFIKTNDYIYSQAEMQSFSQIKKQIALLSSEDRRLSTFFNAKFDDLMSIKQRDMVIIKDKNVRLRYILSELTGFFKTEDHILIEDPAWHPHEIPESIITVEPSEVSQF